MPNPKSARRRVSTSDRQSDLDFVLGRLAKLGATDDEMAEVRDSWFDNTHGDLATGRRFLRDAPDAVLLKAIAEVRDEFEESTTSETEKVEASDEYARQVAAVEAYDKIGDNVATILEWVAADPVRARAVLDLEQGEHGAQRKTLIEPLEAVLTGS